MGVGKERSKDRRQEAILGEGGFGGRTPRSSESGSHLSELNLPWWSPREQVCGVGQEVVLGLTEACGAWGAWAGAVQTPLGLAGGPRG